jgi:four helix bundle protein
MNNNSKSIVNSFRDLIVWQKGMQLVNKVYDVTDDFPKSELFVLTSQMRRSSISIPSNIAEGSVRSTRKDYCNFLKITLGSSAELSTQIEIAYNRKYLNSEIYEALLNLQVEVSKILRSIIKKLKPITYNLQPHE